MSKLGHLFKIKNLKKGDKIQLFNGIIGTVVRVAECNKEDCYKRRLQNPKEVCPKILILAENKDGKVTVCPDRVIKVERSPDDRHLGTGENQGMDNEEVDPTGNMVVRAC
jgi:hypothetical protein